MVAGAGNCPAWFTKAIKHTYRQGFLFLCLMREITTEDKAVFDAYVREQNLKIRALQLPNVRRFFIYDTNPEVFGEKLNEIKTFVYQSFMLLDEDYKPDGEHFWELLSSVDYFLRALKADIVSAKENKPEVIGEHLAYKELYQIQKTQNDENCREIGRLRFVVRNLAHNEEFFNRVDLVAKFYMRGVINEHQAADQFIKATKEFWKVSLQEQPAPDQSTNS